MLEETKDTITVPAAFMIRYDLESFDNIAIKTLTNCRLFFVIIRMLACIHSLRTRRGTSNNATNGANSNANAADLGVNNENGSGGSPSNSNHSLSSGHSIQTQSSSGVGAQVRGSHNDYDGEEDDEENFDSGGDDDEVEQNYNSDNDA